MTKQKIKKKKKRAQRFLKEKYKHLLNSPSESLGTYQKDLSGNNSLFQGYKLSRSEGQKNGKKLSFGMYEHFIRHPTMKKKNIHRFQQRFISKNKLMKYNQKLENLTQN